LKRPQREQTINKSPSESFWLQQGPPVESNLDGHWLPSWRRMVDPRRQRVVARAGYREWLSFACTVHCGRNRISLEQRSGIAGKGGSILGRIRRRGLGDLSLGALDAGPPSDRSATLRRNLRDTAGPGVCAVVAGSFPVTEAAEVSRSIAFGDLGRGLPAVGGGSDQNRVSIK